MLERVEHDNGVVTYRSPLLAAVGVPHAFATRVGGISPPPYDTLNLGSLEKDPRTDGNTNIAENFRRLRRAVGVERYVRVAVRQVHGAEVWTPPPAPDKARAVRFADSPCADAIVTDGQRQLLVIRTADCVPVLLATRDGHVVAGVHAGWRGVVAGVVGQALRSMQSRFGVAPAEVVAAIGPAICVDYFEVGVEVGQAFAAAGLMQATREGGDKPHIDLPLAVHEQLRQAGVAMEAIDQTDRCTYRDADEFFSHRRDVTHRGQSDTGRMAAVIARA
jgi:YfiH family protein